MPQLSSSEQKIERYILPSTVDETAENQAWVELDTTKLVAADVMAISDPENNLGTSLELLAKRVKNWNYTNADGTPTPINEDTIGRLDINDFSFLVMKFGENISPAQMSTTEKKS